MKLLAIVLTLSLLFLSLSLTAQRQKKFVAFEPNELTRAIQQTFDSLQVEQDLKWVYRKLALVDTACYSNQQPPPPDCVSCYGFSDFELRTEAFERIEIMPKKPENLFEGHVDQMDFILSARKTEYENGLVFSLPYTNSMENGKFVDVEIINWDWCGTGTAFRIELME